MEIVEQPITVGKQQSILIPGGYTVELIMKISGHKRTKDFYKYIRISLEEATNEIKEL